MAGYRRAQGRWTEALALYELNHEGYGPDDGCVQSGVSYQEVALSEGECLEHLGRYPEAVELYWNAAVNINSTVAPKAMRRLIDLYSATGQIEVLEKAAQREIKALPGHYALSVWGMKLADLDEEKRGTVSHRVTGFSIFYFEQVKTLREAILRKEWKPLVTILGPTQGLSSGGPYEYRRNEKEGILERTEAVSALFSMASLALPKLESELVANPANPYLKAAVMACRAKAPQRIHLTSNQVNQDEDVRLILWDVLSPGTGPVSLPLNPKLQLQLPTELPAIFKVPEN
jgi:tetratricopeptide (TPR) repeat protein